MNAHFGKLMQDVLEADAKDEQLRLEFCRLARRLDELKTYFEDGGTVSASHNELYHAMAKHNLKAAVYGTSVAVITDGKVVVVPNLKFFNESDK